jgi:REP-associated tyrosine transposase
MPQSHRKLVKHHHVPGHCHELTFSCYRRMPLLSNGTWRAMLSEAIERACIGHDWALTAFVYMPEHTHLLVYPLTAEARVDHLPRAIKRRSPIGSNSYYSKRTVPC